MYCSNCGAPAGGNFCSTCGARLTAPAGPPPVPAEPFVVWTEDVRYAAVVAVPEVRAQIAAMTAHARKRITGEEFLKLVDLAFKPATGGLQLAQVVAIAAPIYSRLGVNTGKQRSQVIAKPVGLVIADTLCSLARTGHTVSDVQQGQDGCVLECAVPSDLRSFAGALVVTISRLPGPPHGSTVTAATSIPGQLYDWGKSQRILDELFTDLTR